MHLSHNAPDKVGGLNWFINLPSLILALNICDDCQLNETLSSGSYFERRIHLTGTFGPSYTSSNVLLFEFKEVQCQEEGGGKFFLHL